MRSGHGGANGDDVGSRSLRRTSVFLPSKAIQESYTERRVLPSSAEKRVSRLMTPKELAPDGVSWHPDVDPTKSLSTQDLCPEDRPD